MMRGQKNIKCEQFWSEHWTFWLWLQV